MYHNTTLTSTCLETVKHQWKTLTLTKVRDPHPRLTILDLRPLAKVSKRGLAGTKLVRGM